MNQQPITKAEKRSRSTLDVVSIFETIQGEGPFAGHPAVFIRLAHCNLQCPGCDTDYTSNAKQMTVYLIYNEVVERSPSAHHCSNFGVRDPLVVITGGEPFRQDIGPLCRVLVNNDFRVQVETNGTLPPSEGLPEEVCVVCSPKTTLINHKLYTRADCFKYVLNYEDVDKDDGLPITALNHAVKGHVARPRDGVPIYVQPMDTKDPARDLLNIGAVITTCMKYNYILQLQTHKILKLP